jgi:hypothetical protein
MAEVPPVVVRYHLRSRDPEARDALRQLLRVAAAGQGGLLNDETVRVVHEVLGDGDIEGIAHRVAWLATMAAALVGASNIDRDGSFQERLLELEQRIEARMLA